MDIYKNLKISDQDSPSSLKHKLMSWMHFKVHVHEHLAYSCPLDLEFKFKCNAQERFIFRVGL